MTYKVLSTISNEFNCHEPLQKRSFDYIILNINELITRTNYIATYISGHEGTWEEDYADIYNQGDVLSLRNAIFQSPISLINNMNLIPSKNNAILYYDENNNWEYRYLSDSLSKLLNTSGVPNENQTLKWDGLKWVYSDFISSGNQQNILLNSDLLKYLNNSLHGGMHNQNPTFSEHVEYVLVYSDGDWSFLQYNPGSSSNPQSLSGYTWWGRSISGTEVKGNLEGDILYIKFGSGTNSVYLGIDSNGNLRLSKSSDGTGSANFYATGGVSALGMGSSGGGSSEQGVTPDLKPILEYINDNDINQSSFEFSNSPELLLFEYTQVSGTDKILLVPLSSLIQNLQGTYLKRDTSGNYSWSTPEGTIPTPTSSLVGYYLKAINSGGTITPVWSSDSPDSLGTSVASLSDLNDTFISTSDIEENGNANNGDLLLYSTYNSENKWKNVTVKSVIGSILGTANNNSLLKLTFDNNNKLYTEARIASDNYLGLIRTNYTSQNDKYYAIKTDSNGNAYVNVPWTDTIYEGGHGVTVSSDLNSNNKYPISAVAADGGGLAVDSEGIKIANTYGGTKYAWGRTYWENGQPKTIKGDLNNVGRIYFEENSNYSSLYLEAWRSEFRDSNNIITGYSDGLHLKRSDDTGVRYFAFEAYSDSDENSLRKESKILMFDTNIIDYEPNILNAGLHLGYGSRRIVPTNFSGNGISMWVYDPDSITANDNNPAKKVLELVASTNETSDISAFQTYLPQATKASSGLRIGNAILYWDSQKDALALCKYNGTRIPSPANFYATGGVSALGFSNGTNSIDAMTFGNLTVNNQLKIGEDVTLLNNNNWLIINGVEGVEINNELQIDGNITCSGVILDDDVTLLYEDPELILRIGNTRYKITKTVILG